MRRLSLSTKLFAAALPLIVAVGGLLALTVRSDLNEIERSRSGAELGGVWEPLITALNAVETEAALLSDSDDADPTSETPDAAATRRATDQAINDVRASIEGIGAAEAAGAHITDGRSALSAARRNIDMAAIAPEMAGDIDPVEAYVAATREFVAVGQLLPSEAGDAQLGRELLAVVKSAEAKLHANDVIIGTNNWPNETNDRTPIAQARDAFASMQSTLGEFEAIAPDEWAAEFRQSGFSTTMASYGTDLDNVARAADAGQVETFDTEGFAAVVNQGVAFQRVISESIVDRANAQADAAESAALRRIGIILAVVLVAALVAWFVTRSITRRIKAVADNANRVATEQLPALVEALRDPRGKAVLPDIEPVNARGSDDLAELARAFNSMQETLIDVAHEQVEVLRRGVSDIFITMARRNRSLIDRQLSMLDEFEAGVDDPDVLSNYYQLDHLATRMRRNSESLLVLANAEPKRRRVKATEIDDVVRASIGEVEDYRRIEIQHLESLQVRGTVVADISHLLAELLDNATSFSPPGSPVRVGGRRADDSYMLRIVDDGVGISPDRLSELNELLREPPIVGLSVESTLGVSVVSLLANKHGIEVTLSAGSPGLTVDVVLPSSLFGPMDAPAEQPLAAADSAQPTEQIVAWNDQPNGTEAPAVEEAPIDAPPIDAPRIDAPRIDAPPVEAPVAIAPTFDTPPVDPPIVTEPTPGVFAEQVAPPPTPESLTPRVDEVGEPGSVAPAAQTPAADWTKMSLDLSEFEPTTGADEHAVEAPARAAEPVHADGLVDLPPPPPAHSPGEFDIPPAPPIGANGLAQRPVTPDTARPAPVPTPTGDTAPALPTRTQRGTGPEGPDRLANPAMTPGGDSAVTTSEPGALQAALAAFDSGRSALHSEPAGDLPTRPRGTEAVGQFDEPQAVTQSRVDPSALRDRLRAFQSEFTNANGDATAGSDIYSDRNDHHGQNDRGPGGESR